MKKGFAVGIIALLFVTSITPVVFGYNQQIKDNVMEDDYLDKISFDEMLYIDDKDIQNPSTIFVNDCVDFNPVFNPLNVGIANSSWPMKCHDLHHTSQSQYSTSGSPDMEEKWRFLSSDWIDGSPVIGEDGIIYFGDKDDYLYALYPNGTLKWSYKTDMWIWSAPAIDENGIIYIGSYDDYLYAINPDGSLKWRFFSDGSITSSPAIGDDGTIYFGNMIGQSYGDIFALNPNGTLKWRYPTGYYIASSPAIADDGTIYIGSGDYYLYAMNPDGTLKWRFETGDYVKSHPSIANDGTIYFSSFDGNTYALNPDGTEKWRFGNPGGGANSASIASDGTIYVCGDAIYALNPDGTLKWTFNIGEDRYIGHSSPAISSDGTIYVGVIFDEVYGGEILVVNPDGTEKWRKFIANDWVISSPCIDENGTVYIGSSSFSGGYLHAFGPGTPNAPPYTPTIDGPTEGLYDEWYDYNITAIDPEGQNVRYWVDWGDGYINRWEGPYGSGIVRTFSYKWDYEGTYTIAVQAEDDRGAYSDWAYLEVTMPVNQQTYELPFFIWFSERFPFLYQILSKVVEAVI